MPRPYGPASQEAIFALTSFRLPGVRRSTFRSGGTSRIATGAEAPGPAGIEGDDMIDQELRPGVLRGMANIVSARFGTWRLDLGISVPVSEVLPAPACPSAGSYFLAGFSASTGAAAGLAAFSFSSRFLSLWRCFCSATRLALFIAFILIQLLRVLLAGSPFRKRGIKGDLPSIPAKHDRRLLAGCQSAPECPC